MNAKKSTFLGVALATLGVGVSFAFAEEHCGAGIGGGSGGDASAIVVNGGTVNAYGGGMSEVIRGGRNLYVSLPTGYSREAMYNDVVSNGREVGRYKVTLAAGESPTGTAVLGYYKVSDFGDGDSFIEAAMKDGLIYFCSRKGGAWTAWAGKSSMKKDVKNEAYPVGSIYTNVGNDLPASIQAIGTWERIASDTFLMAGNGSNAGETGGAATVSLTTDQIPAHSHWISGWTNSDGGHTHYWQGYHWTKKGDSTQQVKRHEYYKSTTETTATLNDGAHNHYMKFNSQNMGSGWAHENRPPYLIVSTWKRTK